ncbi:3'-5' exonuclease [Patescibacteria group bacterium]|nr:3'-5' exonuclease [Patescibacteria group bacterium]
MINKKIRDLKFVALDLEATYSKPLGRHEIIEIGACKLEPGTLNITTSYETLVRPLYRIIPAIKQKTGLTDGIVSKAKPISEIWNEFLLFTNDTILVIYKTIDMTILRKTSEAFGLPPINNSFLDVFKLIKRLYPNEISYSLEHFQKLLKISTTSHRAGADAYVTALLFKHLVEVLENKYKIFKYSELLNFCDPNLYSGDIQAKLF